MWLTSSVWLAPATDQVMDKRQLDRLGPVLKDIMNPASGTTPASSVSATAVAAEDYSDTFQKINNTLDTSEKFMKANGNAPTIKDIRAVLSILAEPLDDDCDHDRRRHIDARNNGMIETVYTSSNVILAPRKAKCSFCERQLYSIVK